MVLYIIATFNFSVMLLWDYINTCDRYKECKETGYGWWEATADMAVAWGWFFTVATLGFFAGYLFLKLVFIVSDWIDNGE